MHRCEFVPINQPRRKGARLLDFEGVAQQSKMETSSTETSIEMVFESDVHDTAWAIVFGMDANVNMYIHQPLLTNANLFQMFGSRTFPSTPTK